MHGDNFRWSIRARLLASTRPAFEVACFALYCGLLGRRMCNDIALNCIPCCIFLACIHSSSHCRIHHSVLTETCALLNLRFFVFVDIHTFVKLYALSHAIGHGDNSKLSIESGLLLTTFAFEAVYFTSCAVYLYPRDTWGMHRILLRAHAHLTIATNRSLHRWDVLLYLRSHRQCNHLMQDSSRDTVSRAK